MNNIKGNDKMFHEKHFETYKDLLLEWNDKINLTAIIDENEIRLKHFADSLTVSEFIEDNSKVVDVGTGAGFPGIPLKIYNDSLSITLVDSLNKRINFLNEVIDKLDLNNIDAVHGRAEDLGRDKEYREQYDIAISRAVANMSTLVEYLLPFVKIGGKAICMKGPNIDEELKDAQKAINILGGEIEKIESLKLGDMDRNIIIIKKIKSTPAKYPRKAGIPVKNPIN